ncbi:MAG: tRNA-dihydrouridine synthase, partial [Pseudomonadota bacterium]
KKVTNGYAGSALMRNLSAAELIIKSIVAAVSVPVTLKMRLGWDDSCLNAPELARIAEGEGVTLLTVHGRTRAQFYKGDADWSAILSVKQAVGIPVMANGDIVDLPTAQQALSQSHAEGVMVGRGAQGRPWILTQIQAGLSGETIPADPSGDQKRQIVLDHYAAMQEFYEGEIAVKMARKHLGWYMDDLPITSETRKAILTEKNPETVKAMVADLPWSDLKVAA